MGNRRLQTLYRQKVIDIWNNGILEKHKEKERNLVEANPPDHSRVYNKLPRSPATSGIPGEVPEEA